MPFSARADMGVFVGARSGGFDASAIPADNALITFTNKKTSGIEIGVLWDNPLSDTWFYRIGLIYLPLKGTVVATVPSLNNGTLTVATTLNTVAIPLALKWMILPSWYLYTNLGGYYWFKMSASAATSANGLTASSSNSYSGSSSGFGGRVGLGFKPLESFSLELNYEPSVSLGTTTYDYGSGAIKSKTTISNFVVDMIVYF
jgi:hypothetical protein